MTEVERLGRSVCARSFADLSSEARAALKVRVLDALGCALGASRAAPVLAVRAQVEDLGGNPRCTLVGGGRSAPDRASLFNGAAVRYLDFNDSYFAPGETCHPSDNFGSYADTLVCAPLREEDDDGRRPVRAGAGGDP